MSYTSSCKKTFKKFGLKVVQFLARGLAMGRWELKWTWKLPF